jgi:hypothetical protein
MIKGELNDNVKFQKGFVFHNFIFIGGSKIILEHTRRIGLRLFLGRSKRIGVERFESVRGECVSENL